MITVDNQRILIIVNQAFENAKLWDEIDTNVFLYQELTTLLKENPSGFSLSGRFVVSPQLCGFQILPATPDVSKMTLVSNRDTSQFKKFFA